MLCFRRTCRWCLSIDRNAGESMLSFVWMGVDVVSSKAHGELETPTSEVRRGGEVCKLEFERVSEWDGKVCLPMREQGLLLRWVSSVPPRRSSRCGTCRHAFIHKRARGSSLVVLAVLCILFQWRRLRGAIIERNDKGGDSGRLEYSASGGEASMFYSSHVIHSLPWEVDVIDTSLFHAICSKPLVLSCEPSSVAGH